MAGETRSYRGRKKSNDAPKRTVALEPDPPPAPEEVTVTNEEENDNE